MSDIFLVLPIEVGRYIKIYVVTPLWTGSCTLVPCAGRLVTNEDRLTEVFRADGNGAGAENIRRDQKPSG